MNSKKIVCSFVSLVLLGVLCGCGGKSSADTTVEKAGTGNDIVTLTKKTQSDIGLTLSASTTDVLTGILAAPAKVLPNQDLESLVGSLVQGRVRRVFVNVGDNVLAGQVLMTVEGLDIGTIKAGFIKAKAALEYSKVSFERQKKLFAENVGSQKALLDNQAEYDNALAEYTAEDRKIHSVGLTDEDVTGEKAGEEHMSGTLSIKSHTNGVIVERNVVVGQFVDATTNAFRVFNTGSVWIDGQIYEKDAAGVRRKTNAVFTTAAYPNEVFVGRIVNIGQTVEEQSRTITVRCEFTNPSNKLKPNMFGELKIPSGTDTKGVVIPDEAVVNESGQQYVFVPLNDSTFQKRKIIAGRTIQHMVEIREGLKEHESVVAKGAFYLKSDLKKEELAGGEN